VITVDDETEITVHKAHTYMPISTELAVDCGLITEEEARAQGWTPAPRPPWRWRLRWRWELLRERAGRALGGWIAGIDLSERDDG